MNDRRVAVVTDAASAGEFFPNWHRYYSAQFGAANLFVATYRESASDFAGFPLGRVLAFDTVYSDTLRSALIGKMVGELLSRYEIVIRCDVDEFLIPHPRRESSLYGYAQSLANPHVTALGLDVIQVEDETPLRLDAGPLLRQRRFCVATSALCKVAVATRPLVWSVGFHFADAPPIFDDLLLFHFKFADVDRRTAWFAAMKTMCARGSSEDAYYTDALEKLTASLKVLAALPRRGGRAGFDSPEFAERVLRSVEMPEHGGPFTFPFVIDDFAREIPEPVRDLV